MFSSPLQTQRQLQVSLEAHGKYISSLIEPETSSPYSSTAADDALLDTLPPLELAISQGTDTLKAPPELNPALWEQNPTWDISHSSATCLPLPELHPLVSGLQSKAARVVFVSPSTSYRPCMFWLISLSILVFQPKSPSADKELVCKWQSETLVSFKDIANHAFCISMVPIR